MEVLTHNFKPAAKKALLDQDLRAAMGRAESGFVDTRKKVTDELLNFEEFRSFGRDVKNHTLANLDYYLELFEKNVTAQGGHVHWAKNGEEANRIILDICKQADARKIIKGKSMVSEEAGTNAALERQGYKVIETDLGEYIIQLAGETPSHIIAPAVHKSKKAVTELFDRYHAPMGYEPVTEHEAIVNQARQILRDHFCSADVGITGGNFLVAETGSVAIITNEGNGDLTSCLPKVHIVTTSIEKVIPDMEALGGFLRLLARSATGQITSVYTTLFNGPKRDKDIDGPEEFHVVLLDNGRSEILGSEYQDILRCIRCGACLNHCPVYTSIGGHAYGWVYPGPMGSVLTPILVGRENAGDLPNACTLNGRCATVCPVKIPLPSLLRKHRSDLVKAGSQGSAQKVTLSFWYALARRPVLYGVLMRVFNTVLRLFSQLGKAGQRGRIQNLPGASAWTSSRDLPAPDKSTFQALWKTAKVSSNRSVK